jgi:hypothetical protein
VMPPPMAATAARLMLAMMIFGCRTVNSLWWWLCYLLIRLVDMRVHVACGLFQR